jgi:hypothetical protein
LLNFLRLFQFFIFMSNLQPFMKFKKLIPFFLIVVLSIQFLPLQRIAAWLSSGQVTEEMAHGLDVSKAKQRLFEKDPALLLLSSNCGSRTLLMPVLHTYHRNETVLIRYADEILTPPPNE